MTRQRGRHPRPPVTPASNVLAADAQAQLPDGSDLCAGDETAAANESGIGAHDGAESGIGAHDDTESGIGAHANDGSGISNSAE